MLLSIKLTFALNPGVYMYATVFWDPFLQETEKVERLIL